MLLEPAWSGRLWRLAGALSLVLSVGAFAGISWPPQAAQWCWSLLGLAAPGGLQVPGSWCLLWELWCSAFIVELHSVVVDPLAASGGPVMLVWSRLRRLWVHWPPPAAL